MCFGCLDFWRAGRAHARRARRPLPGRAPPVHTTCIALRKAWREAYAIFVDTYRGAMERLRQGFSAVDFPTEGCPPPWFAPIATG